MKDRLERLIGIVFRGWKADYLKKHKRHLNEEDIVCFIEGKLPKKERESLIGHLVSCEYCSEVISIQAKLTAVKTGEPPEELLARVRGVGFLENKPLFLEIFLKFKEKMLEIVNTNGDILIDKQLVPAPALRSRKIKDFKNEVAIFKDFNDISVEVRVKDRGGETFDLNVSVKEKQAKKTLPDLRITLLKDGLELESYLTDSGLSNFEHIRLGMYTVEVTTLGRKLATIQLELKR